MNTNRSIPTLILRLSAALALLFVLAPPPACATQPVAGGVLPEAVREAFRSGAFDVPPVLGLGTSAAQTQTTWRVPIIMIGFTDEPLTYTPAEFDQALFDTTGALPTGSAAEYWRWASGGRMSLSGRVVATVALPHDVAYYGFGYWGLRLTSTPNNMYGAIRDALNACEASVDWSEFDQDHDGYVDMLWILHAGPGGEALRDYNSLWSVTSRLSAGWSSGGVYVTSDTVPGSTTQRMRIDRFSSVPEESALLPGRRSEIGVFCHEFGHALGLPDFYDTSSLGGASNCGPGWWSLMAMGNQGPGGLTPEAPSHPGAWALKMLGWLTPAHPTRDSIITLAPIESGGGAVEVSFEGEPSPEYFLVENRQRLGFDRALLSEGLIVSHLDETGMGASYAANRINTGLTPGYIVLEADGRNDLYLGHNRGEASDPFPGSLGVANLDESTWPNTSTILGAPTSVALRDITPIGDAVRFSLQVQAPGWQPARDRTEPGYTPVEVYSTARTAVVDVGGTISAVRSEVLGGIPQIVLRTRRAGTWGSGEPVSASSGSALSPSITALPGGDLATAWSDTRGGASRIFYRARVGGVWEQEVALAPLPGEAFRPSIAADAHGVVYATWLQVLGQRITVMFTRFSYLSPYGNAVALSDTSQTPDDPSVITTPEGHCYVQWADRGARPRTYWFTRFREDSGLSVRQSLIPRPFSEPGAYTSAVDAAGNLHTVWFQSQGSTTEIHYQKRDLQTQAWLRDTIIEVRSETVQSPSMAFDPEGAIHLAYEGIGSSLQQVRYKRWRAGLGWDARSTTLTGAADGSAFRPTVLPRSPGLATVLYTTYAGSNARFMERDRTLDPEPVTAVTDAPPAGRTALRVAPNPLRPGVALALHWSGAGATPPEVEIFDVAGRRLAHVPLRPGALGASAVLEPARIASWPAGLYFARTRDGRSSARLVVLP